MTEHKLGSREEWQAARDELLEREKEHTRIGDELARQRRELPWVPVEKEYRFETEEGTRRPAEAGRPLRRSLPAARLPLHVRTKLRGRLPHLLVDGGRRQRRPAVSPRA